MERRKNSGSFLVPELLPGAIQDRAAIQASKGYRPCAYGSYRLGAFLFQVSDPSRALQFAASALNCLLPYKDLCLAVDTIERNVLPILLRRESLRGDSRFIVCREILNHFEAAGDLHSANEWLMLLQSIARRYALDDITLCRLRLLTHKSELLISMNDDAAGDVLKELREMTGSTENPYGRTPIALAYAGYYSSRGELELAEEIIRSATKKVEIMGSNIKELVMQDNARLRAYARLHLADLFVKRKSTKYFSQAMDLVRESYGELRTFGEAIAFTIGPHISVDEFESRYVVGSAWEAIQRKGISDLAEFSPAADRVKNVILEP
jgi:hypothetical protein